MNASYFTYNGIFSAVFGLKIASFDSNTSADETTIFSPEITTAKTKGMKRFYATNIDYSEPPEFDITMISEAVIPEIHKREILAWLNSGNDFQKLEITKDGSTESYYYMCKLTDIREVKVNGYCVGYTVKAVLDSYYQYGKSTSVKLSNNNYTEHSISITNQSDIIDDYVYPQITFKLNNSGTIKIVNETDDSTREFIFTDIPANKEIIIDNDLKIINGDGAFLSNFNKKWLRLKRGKNNLKITIDGEIEISCPQLMCIGF